MFTLRTRFDGAKYYDKIMKLYMDELPDHYYEKDDLVFLGEKETKEIVKL